MENTKVRKVSNDELRDIFDVAVDIYVNSNKGELSHQQFLAKCYLKACARTLGVEGFEFEEKVPFSPPEE